MSGRIHLLGTRKPAGSALDFLLQRRESGFSSIEVAIAVAISAVLVSTFYTVLRTAASGDPALSVRVDLQLDAVRVLREVTEILKTSGPIDANADGVFDPGDYPYLWNDGVSNDSPFGGFYAYLDRGNAGLVQRATAAQEGLGPSQEIAFRQPQGVLGALVLVPGANGNELQFRRYNDSQELVSTRLLGRDIERLRIETAATEPKPVLSPQQPLGDRQIRITAWFRRVVDKKVYTVRQTCTVNTRRAGD